jgi:cytochrome c
VAALALGSSHALVGRLYRLVRSRAAVFGAVARRFSGTFWAPGISVEENRSVAMRISAILATILLCAACGSDADEGANAETEAPQTFAEQVALGQGVYAAQCARCHGSQGQGGLGPRLVGLDQGALPLKAPAERKVRHEDFVTVGDVANFVVANMPADKPGSLSTEAYLAVLAFALDANGVKLDRKLDLELAESLTIPR